MIDLINTKKRIVLADVLDFLTEHEDLDFYFTKDNARLYITDLDTLQSFVKECIFGYSCIENGRLLGIMFVWKSLGADTKRYYVKLNAINNKIAKDLLTVLSWNFNQEVFTKIRQESKFIEAFKYKGFRFIGGRGVQVLLQRKPLAKEVKIYKKEDD